MLRALCSGTHAPPFPFPTLPCAVVGIVIGCLAAVVLAACASGGCAWARHRALKDAPASAPAPARGDAFTYIGPRRGASASTPGRGDTATPPDHVAGENPMLKPRAAWATASAQLSSPTDRDEVRVPAPQQQQQQQHQNLAFAFGASADALRRGAGQGRRTSAAVGGAAASPGGSSYYDPAVTPASQAGGAAAVASMTPGDVTTVSRVNSSKLPAFAASP